MVEGIPLNTGEPTWQAEIHVPPPGGGTNHAGRLRLMCIRGPSRTLKDQALSDSNIMEKAAADGHRAVRQVANQLQRTKKGHDNNYR